MQTHNQAIKLIDYRVAVSAYMVSLNNEPANKFNGISTPPAYGRRYTKKQNQGHFDFWR